jgi:ABC-type transport system involved in multi-copper enzyme maturation permease subunit
VVIATMSLMTAERDRGTLAWSLTTPVARPAIPLAKWAAGVVALGSAAILVPLALQVVIATIAYGALPDLPLIAGFGVLYLLAPAFWVALAITLGTVSTSTAGVAGIGLLVLFLPSVIGAFAPTIAEISPTAAHIWAHTVVTGGPVQWLVPVVTLAAMAILGLGAALAFDRQDFQAARRVTDAGTRGPSRSAAAFDRWQAPWARTATGEPAKMWRYRGSRHR